MHDDLVGYEFPALVTRLGTETVTVRVVGAWPCNDAYVVCEIPGEEGSIIRQASVVRRRRDLEREDAA